MNTIAGRLGEDTGDAEDEVVWKLRRWMEIKAGRGRSFDFLSGANWRWPGWARAKAGGGAAT